MEKILFDMNAFHDIFPSCWIWSDIIHILQQVTINLLWCCSAVKISNTSTMIKIHDFVLVKYTLIINCCCHVYLCCIARKYLQHFYLGVLIVTNIKNIMILNFKTEVHPIIMHWERRPNKYLFACNFPRTL